MSLFAHSDGEYNNTIDYRWFLTSPPNKENQNRLLGCVGRQTKHSVSNWINCGNRQNECAEQPFRTLASTEQSHFVSHFSSIVYQWFTFILDCSEPLNFSTHAKEKASEASSKQASLRAGSPLIHTRERRSAKRSGGKESGEEAPRKWACLDLRNFLNSASSERSKMPLVEIGKGKKTVNLLCLMERD